MKKDRKMKKFLFLAIVFCVLGLGVTAFKTKAAQVDITISSTDGSDGASLLDDDFNSTEWFEGGTVLTLQAGESLDSLYIKWDSIPASWTLTDGNKEMTCGENGFLHEFIQLSGSSDWVSITIPDGGARIADVYGFSSGELPEFVQKWEPSWDRADMLFAPAHSDDEEIFFGGAIPTYVNENKARVQVVYFCDFFQTESYRNHELLDGLWTMGIDHYPQLGKFIDNYSESLEEAEEQYDQEEGRAYLVEAIRRFKPQVIVTHDENGEYGHGCHQLVSKLIREAVEITGDPSQYPESASAYGTWDVPKTYLHLWKENPIELNARVPLSSFGGKTALTVAREAYQKHLSQLWTDFIVDDGYDDNGAVNDYQYSNVKFGLFRSTVGNDASGNDMLENITTYDTQEKIAEEEAKAKTESEAAEKAEPKQEKKGSAAIFIIIGIIVLLIIVIIILNIAVRASRKKRAKMYRRYRRR